MPHYRDPEGNRYFFDEAPEKGTVRPDLVLMADAEVVEADKPQVIVPDAVSMRQARLALLGAGVLGAVDEALAALPSPMKEAAQIEWEYAAEVRRDSHLVAQLAPALGMTEAQIDALFLGAAAL